MGSRDRPGHHFRCRARRQAGVSMYERPRPPNNFERGAPAGIGSEREADAVSIFEGRLAGNPPGYDREASHGFFPIPSGQTRSPRAVSARARARLLGYAPVRVGPIRAVTQSSGVVERPGSIHLEQLIHARTNARLSSEASETAGQSEPAFAGRFSGCRQLDGGRNTLARANQPACEAG